MGKTKRRNALDWKKQLVDLPVDPVVVGDPEKFEECKRLFFAIIEGQYMGEHEKQVKEVASMLQDFECDANPESETKLLHSWHALRCRLMTFEEKIAEIVKEDNRFIPGTLMSSEDDE